MYGQKAEHHDKAQQKANHAFDFFHKITSLNFFRICGQRALSP
jgi:hypothetical protein